MKVFRLDLDHFKNLSDLEGGGRVTCICRYMGMYHYFGVASGFLGTFLGYSRIFGYHFLAIPGFLGIDFDISINDIVECCLQGSCFYDSTVLVSVLLCLCKEFHIVYITAISLSSYICGAF